MLISSCEESELFDLLVECVREKLLQDKQKNLRLKTVLITDQIPKIKELKILDKKFEEFGSSKSVTAKEDSLSRYTFMI